MKPSTVLNIWLVTVWLVMELWDGGMPTASLTFLFLFLVLWHRLPARITSRFK